MKLYRRISRGFYQRNRAGLAVANVDFTRFATIQSWCSIRQNGAQRRHLWPPGLVPGTDCRSLRGRFRQGSSVHRGELSGCLFSPCRLRASMKAALKASTPIPPRYRLRVVRSSRRKRASYAPALGALPAGSGNPCRYMLVIPNSEAHQPGSGRRFAALKSSGSAAACDRMPIARGALLSQIKTC